MTKDTQDRVGPLPNVHYALYGGMDYSSEPHLLKPDQWRMLYNIRNRTALSAFPGFVNVIGIISSRDFQAAVNLPNGRLDYGLWVLFHDNYIYTVKAPLTTIASTTVLNACGARISTHVYNGKLFFTNPANRVQYFDENGVHELFAMRSCWAVPTEDDDLLGQGPFQLETLYAGETPVGDLGTTFTWTIGTRYRIFVEKPKLFPKSCSIRVDYLPAGLTVATSCSGTVLYSDNDSIVVEATSTRSDVPNAATGPVMRVKVTSMAIPAGRYVTTFFDHVVVGAPTYQGSTKVNCVQWSHLYDFSQWEPNSSNEADKYTFTDYQRPDDVVTGVTGIAHFGEKLLVFTPSCVYAMTYTGLPRVVRVAPIDSLKDFGNGLPYAVAELSTAVVWCDVHHKSFFAFRGGGPEDVGAPIADFFFGDLTTDPAWMAKTFAYVDRQQSEVAWVYRSAGDTTGTYDKAVVYNYQRKAWSVRNMPGISGFGVLHARAKTINELTGVIDDLTGTIDELEEGMTVDIAGNRTIGPAFLSKDCVNREATSTDSSGLVFGLTDSYAETGDLTYGATMVIKEVSGMIVHATASNTLAVKVYVSARDYFDSAVTWTLVGTWTNSLPNKLLTFKPIKGRVLRYKFVAESTVRDFVFRGYEDHVCCAGAYR